MQEKQSKSIVASFSYVFTKSTPEKKPAAEMRPLNDEELRSVAGGPECEVGTGA